MQNNAVSLTGAMLGLVFASDATARTRELPGVRAVSSIVETPDGEAYATGKALLMLNDLPAALAQFRKALLAAPQSLDALNAVAATYDRLGRPDLARAYYEAALAIDPASPALLNNFGYSLYLQGDRSGAIASLRLAAASTDAASAAAAVRTLATVTLTDAARPVFDAPPTPGQRIERTTDGEQRLIFADAPVAREAAESEIAEAASVAPPWSMRDDRRLLAEVVADEIAEHRDAAVAVAAAAVPVPLASVAEAVEVDASTTLPTPAPVKLAVASFTVSVPKRENPENPSRPLWFDAYAIRRYLPPGDVRIGLDKTPRDRGAAFAASARGAPQAHARAANDDPDLKAFAALVRAERVRWT